MTSSNPRCEPQIRSVRVTSDELCVDLVDGRSVSVPLAWYPRLLHGSRSERANWKISAAGYGVHWPDLDEDLSIDGILQGAPAPHSPAKSRA